MDDVAKTMRINLLQDAPAVSSPKIKPKTQMLNSMHLGTKSKTPEAVIRSTYHDFLQYLYDAVLVRMNLRRSMYPTSSPAQMIHC